MPSLTVENYVKTIALIAARSQPGTAVGTGELAQALHVSPGTVTGMLKTLSEASLATYTPYEGARLTAAGERLALKVIRRHRLLELFLARTLQMSWDEVHEEAEHMEHAASERLVDRIEAFLGYPAVDPHGDPIPRADGSLAEPRGHATVRSAPAVAVSAVVRVMDQDPGFPPLPVGMRPRPARRGRGPGEPSRVGRHRLPAGRAERRARPVGRGQGAGDGRADDCPVHDRNVSPAASGSRSRRKGARSSRGVRPSTRSATSSAVAGESCKPGSLVAGGDDQVAIAGGEPDVGPRVDAAGAQTGPGRLHLGLGQHRAEPKRLVQKVSHRHRRWVGYQTQRPPRSPRRAPGRPRAGRGSSCRARRSVRTSGRSCRSSTIWPLSGGVGAWTPSSPSSRPDQAPAATITQPHENSPLDVRIVDDAVTPRLEPVDRLPGHEPDSSTRGGGGQAPEDARDCEPGPGRAGSRPGGSPGSRPARPGESLRRPAAHGRSPRRASCPAVVAQARAPRAP